MKAVIILGGLFLLVGIRVLMKAWQLSGRIERPWLRSMVRAVVAALVFSPAIVPDAGLHGAIPMPAALAVVAGISDVANGKSAVVLVSGLIPMAVVFAVAWVVGLLWSRAGVEKSGRTEER